MTPREIGPGSPVPLGAVASLGGVNFALLSRHATRVRLEFFDAEEDSRPAQIIDLHPVKNRTGDIWHVRVSSVASGSLYAYRVDGPYQPREGLRFNFNRLLLDPYVRAISAGPQWDFRSARGYDSTSIDLDLSFSATDNARSVPKCIFVDEEFDWQEDRPPLNTWSNTIIYEIHVRGLTKHPSSGVSHPGTYSGVIEKLPYFKSLGITALELMPVQEFNDGPTETIDPLTGEARKNYWGYDPVAFSAVKASYGCGKRLGQQIEEFKSMVRACHRAGIEVILDVVFNHTAEGNELGPTFCFRGIDNTISYSLTDDKRHYRDYTGTGNTINANHPVVRDHILSSLRYWVVEMHVDGFRFDLASVLGRDHTGRLLANAPLLNRIAEDPVLRDAKIIAEAWDAGGAYQVGSFSEQRWAEWNGKYRDDVRRFWRGDDGMIGAFASRIAGSSDLYTGSGKGPENSINFLTCHDGFTLNDVVSYGEKHNEPNGEGNRDGSDADFSFNCGVEGPTIDPAIEEVRESQIKNLLLTLFVSRGVPMLLSGDEFRRTQLGNNNAYCQDNEVSWIDWNNQQRNKNILEFSRTLIAFRTAHPVLSRNSFYTLDEIRWCAPSGKELDWSDRTARSFACVIMEGEQQALLIAFNAGQDAINFDLPLTEFGKPWFLTISTRRSTRASLIHSKDCVAQRWPEKFRLEGQSSLILSTREDEANRYVTTSA